LKFNPDGSIQALNCAPTHTAVLTDAVLSNTPTVDGFTEAQDITGTHPRGQSFQVSQTANLTSVALTLFQTDIGGEAPNAGLTLSLYDVGLDGKPVAGTPIATAPRTGPDQLVAIHRDRPALGSTRPKLGRVTAPVRHRCEHDVDDGRLRRRAR